MKAEILHRRPCELVLCVPSLWGETQAKAFADRRVPTGTATGWRVVNDDVYSAPCDLRRGFVHVVLERP